MYTYAMYTTPCGLIKVPQLLRLLSGWFRIIAGDGDESMHAVESLGLERSQQGSALRDHGDCWGEVKTGIREGIAAP